MKPLLTLNLEEITSSTKEKAEALFKTEFAVTATSEIRKYFGIVRCQDPKDRNKIITIKGPGVVMIEDWLTEKFIEESESYGLLKKHFDENFDRIFNECMEKAIQHRCNAIAFKLTAEKMEEKSSTKD